MAESEFIRKLRGKGLSNQTIAVLTKQGISTIEKFTTLHNSDIDELNILPLQKPALKQLLSELKELKKQQALPSDTQGQKRTKIYTAVKGNVGGNIGTIRVGDSLQGNPSSNRPSQSAQRQDTNENYTAVEGNVDGEVGAISIGDSVEGQGSSDNISLTPQTGGAEYIGVGKDVKGNIDRIEVGDVYKTSEAIPGNPDLKKRKKIELELTDGPIKVKVEPCDEDFFKEKKDSAYVMQQKIRGKALIINVSMAGTERERKGTDADRDNLMALWQQLHFEVVVYNDVDDLTLEGMKRKLHDFAMDVNLKETEACIACLLSHGILDGIEATDGKVLLYEEVISAFDNCQNLVGKPKLLIFQACRGVDTDLGVSLDQNDHPSTVPRRSDMFVWYPTQEGFVAKRNTQDGSWFIGAIVQAFMTFAKKEDISALSYLVHAAVCEKVDLDGTKQAPDCRQTLRKKWFFFPGISR